MTLHNLHGTPTSPQDLPSSWSTNRLALVAATVAFLTFLPSVAAGFVYDDMPLIVDNPYAHDTAYLGRCFTTHLWDLGRTGAAGTLRYYRPLACASYTVNWISTGGAPWGFHLVNVLAHALTVWLAARFACRWIGQTGLALAATLLFAVHPTRTESVIWISGRTDVFMTMFGLTALELTAFASERRTALVWMAAAGVPLFVAAATFSKEPGVVFALLCWAEVYRKESEPKNRCALLAAAASSSVITVAYLIFRLAYPIGGPARALTFRHGLLTVGEYIERIVWPWPQTFFYRPLLRESESIHYPAFPTVLGIVALCAYVALLIRARRRSLGDVLLTLSPILFLVPVLHFFETGLLSSVWDRFLFAALLFGAIALARLFPAATRKMTHIRAIRLLFAGTLVIWIAIDQIRVLDYRDDYTAWQHELSLAPDNPVALRWVANLEASDGNTDKAIDLYLRSMGPRAGRYVLLATPDDQLVAYANMLALEAARAPDGDIRTLTAILSQLEGLVATNPRALKGFGRVSINRTPTQTALEAFRKRQEPLLLSEAAFLAVRLGRFNAARRYLSLIPDDRLGAVWNKPNLVLAHSRLFEFAVADRRLAVIHGGVPARVENDLHARISRARRWLERSSQGSISAAVAEALAEAELGAYLLALRALRTAYLEQRTPNSVVGLYIRLLVAARSEDEALRETRRWYDADEAAALVAAARSELSPRVRALPNVSVSIPWSTISEN